MNIHDQKQATKVHIIGGGIMGLMAAIDIAEETQLHNLNVLVNLYEAEAFGGGTDERTTTTRSHLWLHTDGQLYVKNQAVCLALQRSTRRFQKLVPQAFEGIFDNPPTGPLALVLERNSGEKPPITDFYDALGVWYRPIKLDVIKEFFPTLRFPPNAQIYRVRDTVINLPRLCRGLVAVAQQRGVQLIRKRVQNIRIQGDNICSLDFSDKDRIDVLPVDQVVVSCGAYTRLFLSQSGITIPNLRLFQSHLVTTDEFKLPVLALVHDGVNFVPQEKLDGSMFNVFGNYHRIELPPESDNRPLSINRESVEKICKDVEDWFGLHIPKENRQAWAAIKTEISDTDKGSRIYHARRIGNILNLWLALPGKLSQAAACSHDLAGKICQLISRGANYSIAEPIWEGMADS